MLAELLASGLILPTVPGLPRPRLCRASETPARVMHQRVEGSTVAWTRLRRSEPGSIRRGSPDPVEHSQPSVVWL